MSWRERFGEALFRWRSFTPLLLAPVALPLLWRSRGDAAPLWAALGGLSCVAGQAWRAWVLGQVPDGTSGQNEVLIAEQLNTSGPYARTRNPLYLGNLGITLGLCLVSHEWMILGVVLSVFAIQYWAIIAAEERFLRARFGAAFDEYCARVPRFWPALLRAAPATGRPWSLRRALFKEHNPACAWLVIGQALLAWDAAAAGRPLWPWLLGVGTTVCMYLGIKGWKHHWFAGGLWEDLKRRVRQAAR